jgi:hypothetical protein
MKKPWIVVAILAVVVVVVVVVIRRFQSVPVSPPPAAPQTAGERAEPLEAVAFDMQYRGLAGPDDALNYRSFWGFGKSGGDDSAFVQAVKQRIQEFDTVHNARLPNAPWSVVELKDKKPVALYFDLDGDGKLADNEKIPPTLSSNPRPNYEFAFVTPDFTIRQEDGREIPFRVMLVANSWGGEEMNYMWSPCCILEGQATLAGEPMRLFLYEQGFTGSFTTFGRCSFSLVPAGQKIEGYVPRTTLSSLICHDGVFYRLAFAGSHEKDKTLRLTLQKDTSPTGQMAVQIKGKDAIKTRLANAAINGATDSSIQFNTQNAQSALPVGDYKLSSGSALYGVESDDQWEVSFSEGPAFAVTKDQTTGVDLGELTLSVKSVAEQDRYRNDVKEKAVYAKGTSIYLSPQVKGKAGEVYSRFTRKQAESNQWANVTPHVSILDTDGKEVASADMEYG